MAECVDPIDLAAKMRRPLVIHRGYNWALSLTVRDGEGGPVIDLTGKAATFKVRASVNGTNLVSLSVGSGITLGGAAGTIDLEIDKTVTGTLPYGDLLCVLALDDTVILYGTMTVSKETF